MIRSLLKVSRSASGLFLMGCFLALTLSLTAQAQIRYVTPTGTGNGSSWANASSDLQAMITASASGEQVWVAGGTYKPTTTTGPASLTISFAMQDGVAIYGGFAGTENLLTQRVLTYPSSTTLSGEIGDPNSTTDNSYHVISNTAVLTSAAILDGFVITGGNAFMNSGVNGLGGGISNLNNGSPVLRNLLFSKNNATLGGGAMYNVNSSPEVTNCSFQESRASLGGAISNVDGSDPVFVNCSFLFNNAANGGGAVVNQNNSSPTFVNCSFLGNTGQFGGAMFTYNGGTQTLTNCILFNNLGASAIGSASPALPPTASYCLFDDQVDPTTYNDQGNNIITSVSPFVSASSVALNSCTPAIDAGDNASYTAVSGPATDLVLQPRIFPPTSGTIDIGAVEFQGARSSLVGITAQPVAGSAVCVGAGATATVSVSGTAPTYQWYQGSQSLGSAQASATLNLTNVQVGSAGNYSVVVTGTCNSVTSTAFSLTVNAPPANPVLLAGGINCLQLSTTLVATATGATGFTLVNTGQSDPTGSFTVNTPGQYTVRIVNANGCVATTTNTVVNNVILPDVVLYFPNSLTIVPIANGVPTVTTLTNEPLTIQATSGVQYDWTMVIDRINGYEIRQAESNTSGVIRVSNRGPYRLTVTGANGCKRTVEGVIVTAP